MRLGNDFLSSWRPEMPGVPQSNWAPSSRWHLIDAGAYHAEKNAKRLSYNDQSKTSSHDVNEDKLELRASDGVCDIDYRCVITELMGLLLLLVRLFGAKFSHSRDVCTLE